MGHAAADVRLARGAHRARMAGLTLVAAPSASHRGRRAARERRRAGGEPRGGAGSRVTSALLPNSRSPRSKLARALLALLAAPAPLLAQGSAPPPPPAIEHVLLVSLDTTRRNHLGFHGGAARTPNLDRLAREGAVFESAFAPTPITLPSHATLFTGLYPPGHGVRDNALFRLGPEAETLAERLGAAGFRTGAVVSAFVLD